MSLQAWKKKFLNSMTFQVFMIYRNPVYKNYYNRKQKETKRKPIGACHCRLHMEVIIEQT